MAFRRRFVFRITGLFVRWGLISHPYGRNYARERYTLTGRRVPDVETATRSGATPRTRAALVAVALLLMSLLATGVLLASGT